MMPNLYIISGCNGAGKTTASYTILPEILYCREFVNADNIAAGLSPFNPESVAVEAGRLMLKRIHLLLEEKADFAFETTLATRSYQSLIKKAKDAGYQVTLLYFWLSSPELAKRRVASRVKKGGHSIPDEVIERRYYRGKHNFIHLYTPICDNWLSVKTENTTPERIDSASQSSKLTDDVMKGMEIAMGRLVKRSAANNEELVIGEKDGSIKIIPAKDLLSSVK